MGADLTIHVLDGITLEDVARFKSHTLGSKHFDPVRAFAVQRDPETRHDLFLRVRRTPRIEIGEVSWLKAAVLEDSETFVPGPCMRIQELITDGEDEMPVLTPELAWNLCEAMRLPNTTDYDLTASEEDLRDFCREHMGQRIFTVSW